MPWYISIAFGASFVGTNVLCVMLGYYVGYRNGRYWTWRCQYEADKFPTADDCQRIKHGTGTWRGVG
jgi:hypothetical protein